MIVLTEKWREFALRATPAPEGFPAARYGFGLKRSVRMQGQTASYLPQEGREVKKNEAGFSRFASGCRVYGTGVSTTDLVSAPLVIPLTVRVHFPGGSVMVPGECLTNRDQLPVPGKVNSVNWSLTE